MMTSSEAEAGAVDYRRDPSGAHDQDAVAEADQLIQILARQQNANTAIRRLA